MEEHEYESWEEYCFKQMRKHEDKEPTKETLEKYILRASKPDLNQFLEHQLNQVENAFKQGVDRNDHRWSNLRWAANNARDALDTAPSPEIAIAFLKLGETIHNLRHLPDEAVIDALKAQSREMRRVAPLHTRNAKKAALKGYACDIADAAWNKNDSNMRIGAMCDFIWPRIVNFADKADALDLLPNDAEKLKPWIRGIAPKRATKGGAPKKVNK